MRHLLAVVLALASGVIGCHCLPGTPGGDSAPMSDARRTTDSATQEQVVFLDVALIERPRGDYFLEQELWELGNEQGIDLESKPMLEENGLRICQIGGLLPARLQALLTSPRTCPDPRRLRAEPDQPTPVQVGPMRPKVAFQLRQGNSSQPLNLEQAHCFFEVLPSLEGEQGLRLRFTPRIRHGKTRIEPHVTRDPDGPLRWAVEAREPIEDFPQLRWELTVGPNEYVVIAGRPDRPETLGAAYFMPTAGRNQQRVMVIRACQMAAGDGVDEAFSQSPPLALQAAWMPRASRR